MPQCERIRRELPRHAIDGLQGRTRQRIEEHLERCPSCRAELAVLKRTGALITGAGPLSAPPDTWPAISAAILARPRLHGRPARRPWRLALGIAAVLMLFLAIAFVRPLRPSPPPVIVAAEMEAGDEDTSVTVASHLSAQWSTPLADEAAVGLRMSDLEGS